MRTRTRQKQIRTKQVRDPPEEPKAKMRGADEAPSW